MAPRSNGAFGFSRAAVSSRLRNIFLYRMFEVWERLGIHVTPVDYYSPIPDTRELPARLWSHETELVGIDMRDEEQLSLLKTFTARYREEYSALPLGSSPGSTSFFINNGAFESVDAEMLYCMVRHYRPRRVIEIGSGWSTVLFLEAVRANRRLYSSDTSLTCIDPFPSGVVAHGDELELIQDKVENVPLGRFADLHRGDILFIDSSHVLRVGGDVQYELLEIVPRLRPGVLIHVHDIFLPREYPREWILESRRFWSEQYLLQGLLAFNREFEIRWAASYMHLRHPARLGNSFESYRHADRWPGSFWFQRVR